MIIVARHDFEKTHVFVKTRDGHQVRALVLVLTFLRFFFDPFSSSNPRSMAPFMRLSL